MEIILPPLCQFQDSVSEETSTDDGEDTPKFEISTQTSYGLVKRRHVSIQTEIHPCMKSTGTQTELHFSNDHARVDLDESFESLATTTSEASEWTPPETDKNNNLDNQESPSSHHSRKFIVLEECLDQLLRFCTICGRKCDHKKLLLGQCWLFLGFVSAGRLLHGNHNP